MDVKVLSTGKVFYQIDNAIAAILIEMFPAAIEKLNPRPQPKPADLVPMWGVNRNVYSDLYYVTFKLGPRVDNYDGAPSQLVAHFAKSGIVVPEQIFHEYRQLWKPNMAACPPALQNAWWAEYEDIHGK
jgi:hypothetical protein